MKMSLSPVVLVAVLLCGVSEAQVSVATLMSNGDLSIHFTGTPSQNYVAEWADNLIPPMMWTPIRTNTTDSYGLVSFTNSPADSQRFYRVRYNPSAPIPLVYAVENTGTRYPSPPLPALGNLPLIQALPDPFAWASDPMNLGGTRSTNFADWSHHRAEIKAQIENYEIGYKPPVDPAMIFASYSGTATSGTLTVRVTNIVAGTARTLTLTCPISIPAGAGPFPAIIGMNSPNGSISLGGRAIATITYFHNQVTAYNNPQNSNPYYRLYAAPYSPALNVDNTGQYSAWAWGVSRIIDGLYKLDGALVGADGTAQINLQRIGVTGCSYAGKMALFAGALDERIALTIPQESGGGGAPNWRYSASEPTGTVEGLDQTSHQWFSDGMFAFGGANVSYLPEDHHELMAMVAPRALFATGNPDGAVWLSNPSCYVSCKAVEEVYKTFGIADRFGYNIEGGKPHCARTASLDADVYAFLDRFLLGLTNVNTISVRHVPSSYSSIDYASWIQGWGSTNANYALTFEPECETVGTNWNISTDAQASNGKYVAAKSSLQSTSSAPTNSWDWITIPFSLTNTNPANVSVFGRVNCTSVFADSFWVRMDNGPFAQVTGLIGSGWQWKLLNSYALGGGPHTFVIGYSEGGAKLDKISISPFAPTGLGAPAENTCP